MTIDEQIALLQAHKSGKRIQQRPSDALHLPWLDVYDPSIWNFASYDYRVKPEPREWTVAIDKQNNRPYPEDWGIARTSEWEIVKVREVLP